MIRRTSRRTYAAAAALALVVTTSICRGEETPDPQQGQPRPPGDLVAADHPWDGGQNIDIRFRLSPDDTPDTEPKKVLRYVIRRSGELGGKYSDVIQLQPDEEAYETGILRYTDDRAQWLEPHFYRVAAIGPGGIESQPIETTEAVVPKREPIDGGRLSLGIIMLILCGSVVAYIGMARQGRPLKIRKIAGLEAVDEAIGRATEMGRSCLFIPGIQDMNDIQTISAITILSRVSKTAAQYDAKLEVPTSRSLVMTTARETVQASFLAAGRPDAYNEDLIYYVTDEQFGYVAYLSGMMVREKPAACFYLGSFFAESLILAETGNSIGAIQIAGTAQPAQLPFFVAACDYTLIGEELFAASAYLSGSPEELGSLKGQDVGKLFVGTFILIGCGLLTLAALTDAPWAERAADFLQEVILR